MTEVTEQIPHENEELASRRIHQCAIVNLCHLPFLYRGKFDLSEPPPIELSETFAKPFAFYHQTEDTDHILKLQQLTNIKHKPDNLPFVDHYNDDNAETQYLTSNPVSYLILGKPEIGENELAQLIAQNWKCVFISPESVLREEIMSGTRAGKCIKYNLEAGRSIGPEIILRLVEKRIKSQSAQHRGFVISGFPMLKNDLHQEDPISTESAVFNVQEIFEDLLPGERTPDKPGSVSLIMQSEVSASASSKEKVNVDDEERKESDTAGSDEGKIDEKKSVKFPPKKSEIHLSADIDLGPSDTTIVTRAEPFHILKEPQEQLSFIQNLLGQPLVIMYVMSGAIDVRNKRQKYRYNIYLQREVFSSVDFDKPAIEKKIFSVFDEDINIRNLPPLEISDYTIDGTTPKVQVKLPIHFSKSISSQLWQYKCYVEAVLRKYIMEHNPQYFIKVDGRLTPEKMFETIQARVKMLAFQPVLIPQRFTEDEDFGEFAADIQVPPVESIPVEEAFKNLRGKMIVGPMYKYQLSNWAFKCPVALKEGRMLKGKAEYALKFMSKIFFLSSEDALIKFYRNPRPYLLPILPQPACRICVMGPRCSGKSVVAKCLAFLFNCKILDPEILETLYMKRKEVDYLDKLRNTAITEALMEINGNREKERQEQIEKWKTVAVELLTRAITFKFEPYIPPPNKHGEVEEYLSVDKQEAFMEFELEHELQEFGLPSRADMEVLERLLKDDDALLEFRPEELTVPLEPATIFDSFVSEYVDDVINHASIPDMSLTLEETIEMFKNEIDQAEEEYNLVFQRLGGWIIDGMPPDLNLLEKFIPHYLPDEIIFLKDNEPDHIFLVSKFAKKDFSRFKDYKQVFNKLKLDSILDINYSLASASSKLHFIDSVVSEVEDRVMSYVDSETTVETLLQEKNKAYEDHITDFYIIWENVKSFLLNNDIVPMEINVEYKSIQDLLKETVIAVENRYRKIASAMTNEDRDQEQKDFAKPVSGFGEDMFGEGGDQTGAIDFFKDNRRLGYTSIYCPVTFDRYFVLWKGKEEFSVTFEQQTYLLCSQETMNEFVSNPRFFLKEKPPEDFPPPRICVNGVAGTGKTTMATKLAKNYGLHYVNFDRMILDYLDLPSNYDLELIIRLNPNMNITLLNHPNDLEMIKNYIGNDTPLRGDIIKNILFHLWFEEPYKDVGFVLDNFPKRPSDVPILISNNFIPDFVLELHGSQEQVSIKALQIRFDIYRGEIIEKKRIKDLENEKIYNKWQEERIERLLILSQDKREQRRVQTVEQNIENRKLLPTPVQSGLSLGKIEEMQEEEEVMEEEWFVYDEIMEMEDLAEINKLLDAELPEPKFDDVWETEEETKQRILAAFDVDFNKDIVYLDNIRNQLQVENIDSTFFETDDYNAERVLFEIIRMIDQIKFRNKSFFERVYEISLDVADRLLDQGYYFISKFGRTCPVQVYENKNPIQMFLPGENKMNIFPTIYKRYIYFIHGEESLIEFKFNPLKYVLNPDYRFPLIPFRISIIGPPKSGKTTLAKRFEKEYQMNIITRGSAIRKVQADLPNSELAKNINYILSRGWSATLEMVAKAVETLTMDSGSLSQGYVLDGFPTTQQEMNHLRYVGIVPHIILDIQVGMNQIKEYSSVKLNKPPFPTYSFEYIKHLHEEWGRQAHSFRNYVHKEYQNMFQVLNVDSKWHLWDQAREIIYSKLKEFQNYMKNKEYDTTLIVKSLCVTPKEFFTLQSAFLNYCPLCYYFDDYLNVAGPYPDRNCVIQYLGKYYYICQQHQDLFISNPKEYLPPTNQKLLPEDLPKIVTYKISGSVYEDGLCIVSFWDNMPKYVLLQGDVNFTICYKGINYLFCSEVCMRKFMATPYVYYNKIIHFKNKNPIDLCELNKLPTLGFLEQLSARILIDAIIDVELRRPYFVGLNISKSAAIQIGLFLKQNNPKTSKMIVPVYNETKERCDERRNKFKSYLAYFKGRLNPFVNYVARHDPVVPIVVKEESMKGSFEFDINKWLTARMRDSEYGE